MWAELLDDSGGGTKRTYIEVKTVSGFSQWYFRVRGDRAVERRNTAIKRRLLWKQTRDTTRLTAAWWHSVWSKSDLFTRLIWSAWWGQWPGPQIGGHNGQGQGELADPGLGEGTGHWKDSPPSGDSLHKTRHQKKASFFWTLSKKGGGIGNNFF